jgi:PiT family inorganic phosphate transporter
MPLETLWWVVLATVLTALAFDVINGFHDAANSIATIVSTRVLSPRFAVLWAAFFNFAAMAIGTALGGWRIVKTMGMKMTKLKPIGGFCAETAGAFTLFLATVTGIPVSTTHTIAGAIVGVGATTKLSGIKWGVAMRIVWSWVLTIPFSAIVGAACFLLFKSLFRF